MERKQSQTLSSAECRFLPVGKSERYRFAGFSYRCRVTNPLQSTPGRILSDCFGRGLDSQPPFWNDQFRIINPSLAPPDILWLLCVFLDDSRYAHAGAQGPLLRRTDRPYRYLFECLRIDARCSTQRRPQTHSGRRVVRRSSPKSTHSVTCHPPHQNARLSLIHISEPTRPELVSRMPSSA